MKQALLVVLAALFLAPVWQHGLTDQPGSSEPPGGKESRRGGSGSSDCERSLTGTIVDSKVSVQRLLEMEVVNPLNEDIGWIADLILDQCGSITHVIVHVGGFMGIGGEQVAVPVDKIRIRPRGPSSTWVAVVRETRAHMLSGYKKYSRDQTVK